MPIIKPVSDLRNYNDVLHDVAADAPVFLTKNGRGKYAIMDIEDYEKIQATIKLFGALADAELSSKKEDWKSEQDVERELGLL